MVPFGRNKDFVCRDSILQQLLERIPPDAEKDDCQRTAIEGLGGVGKTATSGVLPQGAAESHSELVLPR